MHSSLRLCSRKLPEYLEGPIARWGCERWRCCANWDDDDNPLPNAWSICTPLNDIVAFDDDDADPVPSEAQAYVNLLDVKDHTLWSS